MWDSERVRVLSRPREPRDRAEVRAGRSAGPVSGRSVEANRAGVHRDLGRRDRGPDTAHRRTDGADGEAGRGKGAPRGGGRAHLAGPEQRRWTCPAPTSKTVLELAQKQGKRVGDVSTAEITDATRRCWASHISLRGCQGPEEHGGLPKETRRRAASARSRSRRSTTGWTCCSAAVAIASSRRSTAAPTPGRRWCSRRRAGLPVRDGRGRPRRGASDRQAGARPLHRGQHVAGVVAARPRRSARATRRRRAARTQRPANEPSLAAMTTEGDRLLENTQGLLPAGRGCVDRQAGPRHQRVRPDRRDGRLRRGDRRGPRLPAHASGHAGRRHRRPLAHQPDRARGREGTGLPPATRTNLLTKDGQTLTPDLWHGGLRRRGQRAGRHAAEPAAHRRGGPVWAQRPRRVGGARHQRPHRPLRSPPGRELAAAQAAHGNGPICTLAGRRPVVPAGRGRT